MVNILRVFNSWDRASVIFHEDLQRKKKWISSVDTTELTITLNTGIKFQYSSINDDLDKCLVQGREYKDIWFDEHYVIEDDEVVNFLATRVR